MTNVNDPIALGFVTSLAHPGGNITGLANLSPEIGGKQLELLKAVPKTSRVAVLGRITVNVKEMEIAARSLGLQLEILEVRGADDIKSAFDAAKRKRVNALLVPASSLLAGFRKRVNDLVAQNMPATGRALRQTKAIQGTRRRRLPVRFLMVAKTALLRSQF